MTSIPADSKAFLKPFEGVDVTCLILDVVAWFGFDEIVSILGRNLCGYLKHIPHTQKALWKQLECQVQSEKQFVSSLGVRLLIAKALEVEVPPPPPPCFPSYYNNTPFDAPSTSSVCHNVPRFEVSKTLHNLGNIFIDEAVYDTRAYPDLDRVHYKINRIYDILSQQAS